MVAASRSTKILYLVYWGATEPLGQSLVVPAVKKLAELGAQISLVTFEKPTDFAQTEKITTTKNDLQQSGVTWIPLHYHRNPKVVFDWLQGIWRTLIIGWRLRPDIIHARTFVGGLIGLFIAPLLRARLIYHNEGFFPDEQVDGGVWKKDSRIHRTCKWLEQKMYAQSDAIIALSHRAKKIIETLPHVARKSTPVIVVPSCVDPTRFQLNSPPSYKKNSVLQFVYVGSVGRRHLLDKIGKFIVAAEKELGAVHLSIFSQTDKPTITSTLEAASVPNDLWSYSFASYRELPAQLQTQQAGLLFYPHGLSAHAGSPTKVGEYWAAGLPVIATPNISDIDEIIRRENVGVIVEGHDSESYRRAIYALRELLADAELPNRCRHAAAKYYALVPACERQYSLYLSFQGSDLAHIALPRAEAQKS